MSNATHILKSALNLWSHVTSLNNYDGSVCLISKRKKLAKANIKDQFNQVYFFQILICSHVNEKAAGNEQEIEANESFS